MKSSFSFVITLVIVCGAIACALTYLNRPKTSPPAPVVQPVAGQSVEQSQPQFAQTYLMLGNEYQKLGQPDKAMTTWQLGLQKFPGDATLQKKISGQ